MLGESTITMLGYRVERREGERMDGKMGGREGGKANLYAGGLADEVAWCYGCCKHAQCQYIVPSKSR